MTNWFPSGSLKIANVPHGSFFGRPVNSTPRAVSWAVTTLKPSFSV